MNKNQIDQIDEMILSMNTSMPKNLEKELLLVPLRSSAPEKLFSLWTVIPFLFFLITTVIMVVDNFGFIADHIYMATETLFSSASPEMYIKITGGIALCALVVISIVLYREFSEDFFVPTI